MSPVHPAVVHFPIALVTLSVIADFFAYCDKGEARGCMSTRSNVTRSTLPRRLDHAFRDSGDHCGSGRLLRYRKLGPPRFCVRLKNLGLNSCAIGSVANLSRSGAICCATAQVIHSYTTCNLMKPASVETRVRCFRNGAEVHGAKGQKTNERFGNII